MLCDICQTRQAKIFYTEIVNGQKKEQHLCEQCASEHTVVPLNELLGGQGLSSVGSILSGILSSYAKDRGDALKNEKRIETRCPECGTTESDFLKTGRVGCPVCYNTFRDIIAKNFKTMQGGMTHVGKEPAFAKFIEIDESVPVKGKKSDAAGNDDKIILDTGDAQEDAGFSTEETVSDTKAGKNKKTGAKTSSKSKKEDLIEKNKEKLKEALAVEDYELAAKLRDQIRALEVKNEKKKK